MAVERKNYIKSISYVYPENSEFILVTVTSVNEPVVGVSPWQCQNYTE